MMRYEQIPHTADIAAKIYGKDIPELFENAAFAMFDMMADMEGLAGGEEVKITLEAVDTEDLLVSWLNELLYLSYSKALLFHRFHISTLEKDKLLAEATGQKLGPDKKRLNVEIKAATYHDVNIEKRDDRYEVTVVFDV